MTKKEILKAIAVIRKNLNGVLYDGDTAYGAEYLKEALDATVPAIYNSSWISVNEAMPKEHKSIFNSFFGSDIWTSTMFKKCSDTVLVSVEYESDGTRAVMTASTHDGKWSLRTIATAKVTHWMYIPKPPKWNQY